MAMIFSEAAAWLMYYIFDERTASCTKPAIFIVVLCIGVPIIMVWKIYLYHNRVGDMWPWVKFEEMTEKGKRYIYYNGLFLFLMVAIGITTIIGLLEFDPYPLSHFDMPGTPVIYP